MSAQQCARMYVHMFTHLCEYKYCNWMEIAQRLLCDIRQILLITEWVWLNAKGSMRRRIYEERSMRNKNLIIISQLVQKCTSWRRICVFLLLFNEPNKNITSAHACTFYWIIWRASGKIRWHFVHFWMIYENCINSQKIYSCAFKNIFSYFFLTIICI